MSWSCLWFALRSDETHIDEHTFDSFASTRVGRYSIGLQITRVIYQITRCIVSTLLMVVVVSLGACGWFASSKTLPDTFIGITIAANDLSPVLIERRLAFPLENELRQNQKIHRLNVHIVEGLVCFQVRFDSDQNPNTVLADVSVAVNRIALKFPDAAGEPLIEIVKVGTKENFCNPSIRQPNGAT